MKLIGEIALIIVLLFGVFLLIVGFVMLINPKIARNTLKKAGSTNLVNYAEITVRMIPAAALVISSEKSLYPQLFLYLGWFMLATSFVLYFIPRKWHHQYALQSANILKLWLIRLLSPFPILFGIFLMHAMGLF